MPNPLVNYESASPYLQYWSAHFIARYPNKFDFWELINAVWVDPYFHKDILAQPKYISKVTYFRMTHYIESILRSRRKTKTIVSDPDSFNHIQQEEKQDVVEASVYIFMENNDL